MEKVRHATNTLPPEILQTNLMYRLRRYWWSPVQLNFRYSGNTKIKFAPFLARELQETKINTTRRHTKSQKLKKMVGRRYAMVQNSPAINIANRFDVPVTQVVPVHPFEHWHLLGETQDPRLLSHPWEQIAVK